MSTSSGASRSDLEMAGMIWWLMLKALIKTGFRSKVEASLSGSSKLFKILPKKTPDQTHHKFKGGIWGTAVPTS